MKNFIQPGQVITIKGVTGPIESGKMYKVGELIGVATGSLTQADIDAGVDYYEMALGGVYRFPAAGLIAAGTKVQFKNADGSVDAAGDFDAGIVIDATATTADVLVNGRGEASGY